MCSWMLEPGQNLKSIRLGGPTLGGMVPQSILRLAVSAIGCVRLVGFAEWHIYIYTYSSLVTWLST